MLKGNIFPNHSQSHFRCPFRYPEQSYSSPSIITSATTTGSPLETCRHPSSENYANDTEHVQTASQVFASQLAADLSHSPSDIPTTLFCSFSTPPLASYPQAVLRRPEGDLLDEPKSCSLVTLSASHAHPISVAPPPEDPWETVHPSRCRQRILPTPHTRLLPPTPRRWTPFNAHLSQKSHRSTRSCRHPVDQGHDLERPTRLRGLVSREGSSLPGNPPSFPPREKFVQSNLEV